LLLVHTIDSQQNVLVRNMVQLFVQIVNGFRLSNTGAGRRIAAGERDSSAVVAVKKTWAFTGRFSVLQASCLS
jgi:hypothetical protein